MINWLFNIINILIYISIEKNPGLIGIYPEFKNQTLILQSFLNNFFTYFNECLNAETVCQRKLRIIAIKIYNITVDSIFVFKIRSNL